MTDSGRETPPSRLDRSGSADAAASGSHDEAVDRAVELLRPLLRDPEQAPQTAAKLVAAADMFIGPLPHPSHLSAYEDVVLGSAKDIIMMAKQEQAHHHRNQSLEMLYPYFGLAAGFTGFVACIAGACVLALRGHDTVAGLMLGVPTLGVIGWFVNSRLAAPGIEQPAKRRR